MFGVAWWRRPFRTDAAARVAGFIAVGTGDKGYLAPEYRVATAARDDGMPVILDVIPGGGHNFRTWARALREAFPWIVGRTERLHVTRRVT